MEGISIPESTVISSEPSMYTKFSTYYLIILRLSHRSIGPLQTGVSCTWTTWVLATTVPL